MITFVIRFCFHFYVCIIQKYSCGTILFCENNQRKTELIYITLYNISHSTLIWEREGFIGEREKTRKPDFAFTLFCCLSSHLSLPPSHFLYSIDIKRHFCKRMMLLLYKYLPIHVLIHVCLYCLYNSKEHNAKEYFYIVCVLGTIHSKFLAHIISGRDLDILSLQFSNGMAHWFVLSFQLSFIRFVGSFASNSAPGSHPERKAIITKMRSYSYSASKRGYQEREILTPPPPRMCVFSFMYMNEFASRVYIYSVSAIQQKAPQTKQKRNQNQIKWVLAEKR